MSARIVDCQEAHVPALQRFFARVYRPDYALCDVALLRWQFQQVPGADGARWHVKLALVDDAIVGCLGYIPLETSAWGHVVRAAWVVNWMVDPEQRRLGLGPLLMREVMREFEMTLNVGPNRDARELLSRMGWQDVGELPRYIALLDAAAAAPLMETGRVEWPEVAPLDSAFDAESSPVSIAAVERFSTEATRLWDTASRTLAGTRRSTEFLNWRYAEHPSFRYRMFEQYRDDRLTGLAVYRIETALDVPVRVGRLVEYLEAPLEHPASRVSLLTRVLEDARAAGVAMMDFFCSDRRLSALLKRHGFVADQRETSRVPVLLQPVDRTRTGIAFMAHLGKTAGAATDQWYVTKGDGDQDRPNWAA